VNPPKGDQGLAWTVQPVGTEREREREREGRKRGEKGRIVQKKIQFMSFFKKTFVL
jgi:hypothetical protein